MGRGKFSFSGTLNSIYFFWGLTVSCPASTMLFYYCKFRKKPQNGCMIDDRVFMVNVNRYVKVQKQ